MAVFRTIPSYVRHQEARLRAVARHTDRAHQMLGDEGKKDFQRMTGGPLKTKTLRRMGHPYAKTGGVVAGAGRGAKIGTDWRSAGLKGQISRRGTVNPLPINIQSGRLRRGIQLTKPSGYQKTMKLFSDAPHARFVLAIKGTDKTIARGLKGPQGYLRKMHKLRKHVMKDELLKAHRSV